MEAKSRILMFVKAEHKRRARHRKPVEPFLVDLPLPADLQKAWPALWQSIFPGDGPKEPPISQTTQLPEVRCRVSKKMQKELSLVQSRGAATPLALPADLVQLLNTMHKSHSDLVNLTLTRGEPTPRALGLTMQALADAPAPRPSNRPWTPPLHALHDASGAAQAHAIEDVPQVATASGAAQAHEIEDVPQVATADGAAQAHAIEHVPQVPIADGGYSGGPSILLAGSSGVLGPTIDDVTTQSLGDTRQTLDLIDDLQHTIGAAEAETLPELSPFPSFHGSDGCPSNNLMCPHCYADLHAYSPVPFGEYCKFCSEYGDPDLDSNPEHHAADRRQRPETAVVESLGDTVPDAALVELYPPPPSRSAPPLALQILHTMQADKQAKQEQTKNAAKAERDRAKAAKGKTNANLKKAKADAPKADAQAGEATGSTTLVQTEAGDTEGLLSYASPPARPAPFSKAGAKPQASPKAGGKGQGPG